MKKETHITTICIVKGLEWGKIEIVRNNRNSGVARLGIGVMKHTVISHSIIEHIDYRHKYQKFITSQIKQ